MEAVLIPDPSGERVSDELDARASTHYDTKTLWLTMAIDQMRFIHPGTLIAKSILARSSIGVVTPRQARG